MICEVLPTAFCIGERKGRQACRVDYQRGGLTFSSFKHIAEFICLFTSVNVEKTHHRGAGTCRSFSRIRSSQSSARLVLPSRCLIGCCGYGAFLHVAFSTCTIICLFGHGVAESEEALRSGCRVSSWFGCRLRRRNPSSLLRR